MSSKRLNLLNVTTKSKGKNVRMNYVPPITESVHLLPYVRKIALGCAHLIDRSF